MSILRIFFSLMTQDRAVYFQKKYFNSKCNKYKDSQKDDLVGKRSYFYLNNVTLPW